MKRIVTMQDISCVGKCSLTVALPIISACGIETAVIPTAVLSTHTAFSDFTFRDLTEDVPGIKEHWKKEDFHFDAIYTGYLGSQRQIDLVKDLFSTFPTGTSNNTTLRFIDPAMADNGSLYKGFTTDFAASMAKLGQSADVIVPNLTEACLMSGTPYREDYTEADVKEILRTLGSRGTKKVVMTGAGFQKDSLGALCYDAEAQTFLEYYNEKMPVKFHGTGDIFASTMLASLVRGLPMETAMAIAVDFTLECIRKTMADPDRNWYGVNFEQAIPFLVERLQKETVDNEII